jgi:hypothetical protein
MDTRRWVRWTLGLVVAVLSTAVILLLSEKPSVSTTQAYPPPGAFPMPTSMPYPAPSEVIDPIVPTPPAQVIPPHFTVPPNPTYVPSEFAEMALAYVAQREGLAISVLEAAYEHDALLPVTNQQLRVVTVIDKATENTCQVAINTATGEITEWQAAQANERAARREKYGKLDPLLHERLEGKPPTYEVKVLIRTIPIDFAAIQAELEERYSDVDPLTIPFLVSDSDPELRTQVMDDYYDLLSDAVLQTTRPVAEYLADQGYAVEPSSYLPAVEATLPKAMIEEIANRDDVHTIFLAEIDEQLVLNSAIPTDHAPRVWDEEIDGTGQQIAIVEWDCVGKPNGDQSDWVIVDAERPGCPAYGGHPSRVATAAASFHPTHSGVAPGAHVLSAWRIPADVNDLVASFDWASNHGAGVLNVSTSAEIEHPYMTAIDWAVDWYRRYRNAYVTVVAAAGNHGGYVGTPGKAYNVITVGGTDDRNTAGWSDDIMWDEEDGVYASAWMDPASGGGMLGVREKPDLVAVAANLEGPGSGSTIYGYPPGTSHATAQVSGLASLVLHQSSRWNPYNQFATKAVLMVSATNNISDAMVHGDDGDWHDGASAINAEAAVEIAEHITFGDICYEPCYGHAILSDEVFGASISGNMLQGQPLDIGQLWATKGEYVRVATQWFSDSADPYYGPDDLMMRLWTQIVDSNGDVVAESQLAEPAHLLGFYAQITGSYTVRLRQLWASNEQTINPLGWAWTRIRPYDATYVAHQAPACVDVGFGSTIGVQLTVRNEGYVEWVASYERLGYRWYTGHPPVGDPIAENSDVASFGSPLFWYGDVEGASLSVPVPTGVPPGLYTLQWDMVSHQANGDVYWFSEQFADEPLDIPVILGDPCQEFYLPSMRQE